MHPVSTDYKNKIQELDRIFNIEIRIEHSKGTLILGDNDIAIGSFVHHDSSQVGDEFTVGGTYAGNIEFKLVNKSEYDGIDFVGARVYPKIGLLIREEIDAHFIQASQPSKMKGFDDVWEYVSLGVFNIDIADRHRSTIDIKAIDNMIFLDKPYSLSKLVYPATLYQIYVDICNIGDFGIGTPNFTNKDYVVQKRPTGDLTLRNVLGFVAELSGSFAKFNRFGNLELKWYTQSNVTITPSMRSQLKMKDFNVKITGISFESEDKDSNGENILYLTGTDDYAIDLSGNVLLQDNYHNVLPNILSKVGVTNFTPYNSSWHGNPALQVGDIIKHIDVDGVTYNTLVTNTSYKYRGTSTLDGKALPNISRGYKSNDNRVAQIIQKIEKDVGDKLTTLEQAQFNATELMANMLGGHLIIDNEGGNLYVANKPTLAQATEYWKWGIGGFAHYVNGVLDTSITADGSIVAMLVAANIITANMIHTGILQSEDGGTTLNLDTGDFNFRDIFKLNNSGATINVGDVASGNYISLSPNAPLNVYKDGNLNVSIYTEGSMGGYVAVYSPDGSQAWRVQGLGDNVQGFQMQAGATGGKGEFFIRNPVWYVNEFDIQGDLWVNGYIGSSNTINMQKTIDMLIIDSLEG